MFYAVMNALQRGQGSQVFFFYLVVVYSIYVIKKFQKLEAVL